ncbi:cell division protein FtsX [Arachidicoccus sp.]|uniref:cell division protein FtsX n=1 Tax=Arachidicoccus sp. TaxID=1872624 RepID=UPI003D1DE616
MSENINIPKRKKKSNSVLSIVGISVVLLLMGVMSWIFLNLKAMGNNFQEQIEVCAYLNIAGKDSIAKIQNYIETQPYAKNVRYIDKEKAKEIWNQDNNEDWNKILDYNPLPESINFYAKAEYVNKDSLAKISNDLMQQFGSQLSGIDYPKTLVSSMNNIVNKLGLIFLVVMIGLGVMVVVSIDNTIKLTMYSNRFLIKTMQMVGATRKFIARPMNNRAVLNGLISALVAIVLMVILVNWTKDRFPEIGRVEDIKLNYLLYACMLVFGVLISWISTNRSVNKYLKSRLDDLY